MLKHALFTACFTDGENPGAREVLIRVAGEAGLDAARAQVIVNDRRLIQGGQPAAVFEQALRQIATGN